MRGWWLAGAAAAAAAWVLITVVQIVARDPLPPQISVSQYGVGPHGWLFSAWMACLAAAPLCLYRFRPAIGFGARWWLGIGLAGAAVMAIVRTDPGGLQRSAQAKVHLGGAVLALSGLPIGMLLCLLAAAAVWRRLAFLLVGLSAASLALLLLSAAGVDTTGAGPQTSWAFWQAIAVIADLLLLAAMTFGMLTVPPLASDPEPWWAEPPVPTGPPGRLSAPPGRARVMGRGSGYGTRRDPSAAGAAGEQRRNR